MLAARTLARSSLHSSYSVRKPSSSTWISRPAIVVTGMALPFCIALFGPVFSGHRHENRAWDGASGKQDVPVDPPERELAPVIDVRLLEKAERANSGHGVLARKRFGFVVEVDQNFFSATGFDEAVCVPVELLVH